MNIETFNNIFKRYNNIYILLKHSKPNLKGQLVSVYLLVLVLVVPLFSTQH